MNSTIKLIRKFCSILIISIVLGILLNLVFLIAITWIRGRIPADGSRRKRLRQPLVFPRGGAMFSQRKERRYWSRREPGGSWWRMIQEM